MVHQFPGVGVSNQLMENAMSRIRNGHPELDLIQTHEFMSLGNKSMIAANGQDASASYGMARDRGNGWYW
jgi:hypothetical protein